MKKLLLLPLVLAFCACSVCKVAKQSPITEIQFGSGGGFTGAVTTYTLKNDGSLWKQDDKIKKLSCDSISSIYDLAEQLPKVSFVHPSNTYSFVRIISSGTTYYYTWSFGTMPDKKVTELYKKLNRQL